MKNSWYSVVKIFRRSNKTTATAVDQDSSWSTPYIAVTRESTKNTIQSSNTLVLSSENELDSIKGGTTAAAAAAGGFGGSRKNSATGSQLHIDYGPPTPLVLGFKSSKLQVSRNVSTKSVDTAAGGSGGGGAQRNSSRNTTLSRCRALSNELFERFKKTVPSQEHIIKISAGGLEGSGPWDDDFDPTPCPKWQLDLDILLEGKTCVHVVTFGKPGIDIETGQECRRIKIYEHMLEIANADLERIASALVLMRNSSEESLADALRLVVDPILRSPESPFKLTDKILTKSAAISSLGLAQLDLAPVFGTWLNPLLCLEADVKASSANVFVCTHNPRDGAVAHVFTSLDENCNRDVVQSQLMSVVPGCILSTWEMQGNMGFSLCVVTPPGRKGSTLFA
ncbi:hypothetical protein BDR26DRAFT_1006467 [Obelidium mucronatum]|nr:hypothetical protein BDR26DRAFT_1006467 [Obelidium mucronatum]